MSATWDDRDPHDEDEADLSIGLLFFVALITVFVSLSGWRLK